MSEIIINPSKRTRIDFLPVRGIVGSETIENRLLNLEQKMESLMTACSSILSTCEKLLSRENANMGTEHDCCASLLLPKILFIDDYIKQIHKSFESEVANDSDGSSNPVVLVQEAKLSSGDNFDSNVQVLTLNSENDIPEGSWLGDVNDPKARVRVNIRPSVLMHINSHCSTPEKMALSLLDRLFSRDVLAVSNLSGKGKHSKKQLDPLLIYGIRCHLVHMFNITDKDWHRIKQNIDSKCRSEWRKKIGGITLDSHRYKGQLTLADPLDDESSDGVLNLPSLKPRKLNKTDKLFDLEDKQSPVKVFTDEELKELLPTSVELFIDNECFSLADQTLGVQECVSDGSLDV